MPNRFILNATVENTNSDVSYYTLLSPQARLQTHSIFKRQKLQFQEVDGFIFVPFQKCLLTCQTIRYKYLWQMNKTKFPVIAANFKVEIIR